MGTGIGLLNSKVTIGILAFLAENSGIKSRGMEVNLAKHIESGTGYSRKGVHDALKKLSKAGYVTFRQVGRSKVYELNTGHPVVRQFKTMKNIIELTPLAEKLKTRAAKVILYGSCSRGEDTADSDIDLAITAQEQEHEAIKGIVASFKSARKINSAVFSPFKFVELEKKDKIYYAEIDRGIVLWEGMNEQ